MHTAAQEIIARQRKRKRRPERATDGTTYLPYRESSGALRALQEVRNLLRLHASLSEYCTRTLSWCREGNGSNLPSSISR